MREGLPVARIRAIRAGAGAGYDRIVFEATYLPGYRVGYAPGAVTQCGSGDTLDIPGRALLSVRLSPAHGHTEDYQAVAVPVAAGAGLEEIVALARACDFEAEFELILGLPAQRPFRVLELAGPPRLVVDVAHGPKN